MKTLVLIACVLFSHRSEYCTFVISAIGVALWYAMGPKTPLRLALLVLASIAHGPFFVRASGLVELLTTHREFHPLRLAPLALVFVLTQVDMVRSLLGDKRTSPALELQGLAM